MNEPVFEPAIERIIEVEVQPVGESVQQNALAVQISAIETAPSELHSELHGEFGELHGELHSAPSELHSELEYTVEELVKILKVGRRQIFNYARTICEANKSEPESAFKPRLGIYSKRMLKEMRALQSMGPTKYQADRAVLEQKKQQELARQLEQENSKPVPLTSALVVSQTEAVGGLDGKIAKLQQQQRQVSGGLSDRIAAQLQQIEQQNVQQQTRTQDLNNAMLVAAENAGVLEGLEIFKRQQAAREATIAHLKAQELAQQLGQGDENNV